jgi:hypothetical protein
MRKHTTEARDAALLKLRRVNRWLIAGSILLTGVLADVAASAFPGRKKAASSSTAHRSGAATKKGPTGVLAPPEKAPEASGESRESDPSSRASEGDGSSSGETTQSPETQSPERSSEAQSSERSPESQSSETSRAPETSSEAHSGSSSEPSEPVVSGGS